MSRAVVIHSDILMKNDVCDTKSERMRNTSATPAHVPVHSLRAPRWDYRSHSASRCTKRPCLVCIRTSKQQAHACFVPPAERMQANKDMQFATSPDWAMSAIDQLRVGSYKDAHSRGQLLQFGLLSFLLKARF